MHARKDTSVALLLIALALSPAWAQNAANPPAQPDAVQKFLNTPVWYLNYRISLVCRGTDASLQRVTNGSVQLGIRSQGPSLSMLNMDPAQLQGQAFFDMIPNYANWIGGCPPDETQTPQQQDAEFTRVMEQNQKAHERYHFSSQSTGESRSSTRMSGSAPVTDLADYHLEIDAVKKKYKFKLSSGFADTQQSMTAVVGETVSHIGTANEHHLPIETSMRAGASETILSSTPQLSALIEGDLPAAFGSLSGSPSHAVVVRAYGQELKGTLVIQISLSPTRPEPAELIIITPSEYENWRPTGGKDEKISGDWVPVAVKLQKRGGGEPQFKADRFVYRLTKSSRERGICMNWPANPEADSPFDLQFEPEYNQGYDIIGTDRQMAEQFGDKMTEGEVAVSCFDYGAYGELEVLAELENGEVVYGTVQGTQNRSLKLPARADDSLISKAFLKNLGNLKDDDDAENDPVGDTFLGDGLSLYEEYRGFMVGDYWAGGDPKKKDVFVLNQMRGMPAARRGIKIFEGASGLNVHSLLKDNQVNAVMMINYWATSGPHLVDQHVIRIQSAGAGARVEKVGTPGTAKSVHISPGWEEFRRVGLARVPSFERTIAHEMAHSCNVYHHGEADEKVKWIYTPNPVPHFVERGEDGDIAITLKLEDGSTLDIGRFMPNPTTTTEMDPVLIGVQHGQHSGHADCLMRYWVAIAYPSITEPSVRYLSGGEFRGFTLCATAEGTGINEENRFPQSRYGPAATADNGGELVKAKRGDCKHQIRVNDKGQEPER